MKCKICKEEINLTIHGMPNDMCWECYDEKTILLNKNIKGLKNSKYNENS